MRQTPTTATLGPTLDPSDAAEAAPGGSFGALYAEHRSPALRLAYLLCGDTDRAEEAVAEAFCRVYPHWRKGQVADAGAYIRRAVVNELRSRGRRRVLELREERRRTVDRTTLEDVAQQAVERDRIRIALAALPIRQRAAVVLRFYEDLPEAQVAAALGISVGTVKSSVSRGLARLRGALTDEQREEDA
ncbi:MAG TPA: SigE family RNA polymerase sigma factor [Actinomycetota bacterium]|nr:SigE family RNA polymerase sigma factor [Actinomycetota bacterium]